MKKTLLVLIAALGICSGSIAATTQQPQLNAADPVANDVPSEQAVDMQTFDYESKHDAETMSHSNTPPAPPADKPLPDAVITQDVMSRFGKVYQQKKVIYDQTIIQLNAAKDDLAQCSQLSGSEKTECEKKATDYINTLTQKASNIKFDLDQIKKEMQAINPGQ